jgi:hypothetical protein
MTPFDNLYNNLPFFQQENLRRLLISPITPENRDYLQNSQCTKNGVSMENGRPLVCCPNPTIQSNQQSPINNNAPTYPPNSFFGSLPVFQQNPILNNPLTQNTNNQPPFFDNSFGLVPNLNSPINQLQPQTQSPEIPSVMTSYPEANNIKHSNAFLQPGQCGKSLESKYLGQISERIVGGLHTEINGKTPQNLF